MGKMTLQQILMQLAGGMGTSIQIFAVTLVFSLPLGLFVALGRMSRNKILQAVIKVYISVMRGTPLMLQLLVVYFGPYYMFGMRVSNSYRLWAVFIGFVINYAAYFAEIYRSGIQSMPVGQYEAAKLLGYSKSSTGDQAHSSFCYQRSDHFGKRHFPGIYIKCYGNVHHSKSAGFFPGKHDAFRCSRHFLLCIQPDRCHVP